MAYQPQFTISPTLLSLVEEITILRERILRSRRGGATKFGEDFLFEAQHRVYPLSAP
jgi:hypothetical protein